MELLQVDAAEPEVLQALFGRLADVVGGEDVVEARVTPRGPLEVLGRDLVAV